MGTLIVVGDKRRKCESLEVTVQIYLIALRLSPWVSTAFTSAVVRKPSRVVPLRRARYSLVAPSWHPATDACNRIGYHVGEIMLLSWRLLVFVLASRAVSGSTSPLRQSGHCQDFVESGKIPQKVAHLARNPREGGALRALSPALCVARPPPTSGVSPLLCLCNGVCCRRVAPSWSHRGGAFASFPFTNKWYSTSLSAGCSPGWGL